MKHCHPLAACGAVLLAGLGAASPVAAQTVSELYRGTVVTKSPAEAEAVRNRRHEEYDPVGGRIGTYFLYPWLADTVVYDDNVYATPKNAITDGANVVNGGLLALSNFPRHALNFRFDFDNYNYFKETRQDRFDARGVAQWRLDFAENLQMLGYARAERGHERPGSLEAPSNALEPVPYNLFEAGTTLQKRFNRLTGSVTGTVATISYENVPATGGGTLKQHYRDGQTYTLGTKWGYEFSPGYAVFGLLEGNTRDYNKDGYGRSSDGFMALAGVEMDVTALIHGEFGAGYLVQDYDKKGLKDIDAWAMRGALVYNPTGLMTFTALAERRVAETIQTGASGRLDTVLALTLDYELLRNLILSPYISYIHSDYEGSGRKDNVVETGINADYLINRMFSASLFYEYKDRNSNFATYDYTRNYAGIGLKARF
ncbi:outer membrane beta-barrel protein [Rhodoligotrophos defluvii]|uniref:outer membrane beta-barrel protein n=1 Tax=Rhodoligotrophos defluvii TaxID=2561934 RepID=UPI0010C94C46|nr:outer membrane beta-barrel protein [Rhodoligotrophos defluvii]